jgi:hypothetical protein
MLEMGSDFELTLVSVTSCPLLVLLILIEPKSNEPGVKPSVVCKPI